MYLPAGAVIVGGAPSRCPRMLWVAAAANGAHPGQGTLWCPKAVGKVIERQGGRHTVGGEEADWRTHKGRSQSGSRTVYGCLSKTLVSKSRSSCELLKSRTEETRGRAIAVVVRRASTRDHIVEWASSRSGGPEPGSGGCWPPLGGVRARRRRGRAASEPRRQAAAAAQQAAEAAEGSA
jgi:hypothetical protein